MNTDFLGKGLAFPLSVSARGGLAQSQQAQKIRDSIRTIVGTQHGERLMRPNFGCNLNSLVFAPNNKTTANLARYYVETGLTTWEPRILLDQVVVENHYERNCLMIHISYTIKSTHEPQSLVYPFYLEAQSGT